MTFIYWLAMSTQFAKEVRHDLMVSVLNNDFPYFVPAEILFHRFFADSTMSPYLFFF